MLTKHYRSVGILMEMMNEAAANICGVCSYIGKMQ